MISTKFIRFSFDKLARTHKIARSLSPRVLVPKPVPTGSAYVTHASQEPHFGSDKIKDLTEKMISWVHGMNVNLIMYIILIMYYFINLQNVK